MNFLIFGKIPGSFVGIGGTAYPTVYLALVNYSCECAALLL